MMRVCRLYSNKTEKDSIMVTMEGVEGDRPRSSDRHLTILPERIRHTMEEGKVSEGFCTKKYRENITIESLPKLTVQTELEIGEVTVRITEAGKHCFDHCILFRENRPCELPKEAYYATVLVPGKIRLGDEVKIRTENER